MHDALATGGGDEEVGGSLVVKLGKGGWGREGVKGGGGLINHM